MTRDGHVSSFSGPALYEWSSWAPLIGLTLLATGSLACVHQSGRRVDSVSALPSSPVLDLEEFSVLQLCLLSCVY